MPSPRRKILILELWGIGDLTFSTILIHKALEAGDEVHLLGKPHARQLLEPTFPSVTYIPFEAGWTKFIHKYRIWEWNLKSFFSVLLRLRGEQYDMAVSARNDPRDHFLMWLIKARRRFGFPHQGYSIFLTDAVKRSKGTLQHKVRDWRDLGLAMGYRDVADAEPQLSYAFDQSSQILKQRDLPLLVVHVGARIAVRRWPVAYFEDLIRRLRETFHFYLILIPDPDGYGLELSPLADLVLQHLSLSELTSVIGRADLVLCNDSGPGHLAAICERPTISIFGPTESSWFRPWGAWHRVVRRDFCPRLPCFDYCHFPEPYCMTRLTPTLVWPEIKAYIHTLAANGKLPAKFVPDGKAGVPFVAVVMATYRRPAELARLLRSLEFISTPMAVIVTDNADDPETTAVIEATSGRLEVIRVVPGRNLGCGGGLALAEREALRRYGDKLTHFWIMDDDVEVMPEALAKLLAAMDEEKAISACPMVLDGKDEIGWFPGLLSRPVFNAIRKRHVRTPEAYRERFGEKAVPFSWATGVSLLVERGAVEAVGFHQGDFLIRGEDLDFSLRLTAWGKGVFVPQAWVRHLPPLVVQTPEIISADRRKHAILLQNLAYISLYLAHGRRIIATLPGNFWRFLRIWGISRVMEGVAAYYKGGIGGVPAGRSQGEGEKVLVFAHTPPPHHGQSFMVKLMLDHFCNGACGENQSPICCYHVDCRLSDNMQDVGTMRFGKIFHLLGYCLQAIWYRFRYGVRNFYYVPAPGKRTPLYRDWMVMLICRPFFKQIIFHWHASGLSEWLETEGTGFERWVTRLLLGRPSLSIALAEASSHDAQWFRSKKIAIVPNGIPDPCSDFDSRLLPRRKARIKERRQSPGGIGEPVEFRLCYVAHCTRDKGLFDTLEGIALFNRNQTRWKVRFTVAGAFMSPEEEREFHERIQRPDLAGVVTYAGFILGDEKKALFEDSDCLCFPTYYLAESFPLTLVEAAAYGLPSVVTRWRAIPEIQPPDYPGFVEAKSPQQICAALECLAVADLTETLRARFISQFSLAVHLEKISKAICNEHCKSY